MDIDYLVIADAAVAAGGKLYIHGAGWDTLWALSFPMQYPQLAVALRLRVPWSDTNQPHMLEVDVIDADGNSIIKPPFGPLRTPVNSGRPPTLPVGEDQVAPLTVTIAGITFPGPGTYVVVARIDDNERARSPFRVVAVTAPGLLTSPQQPQAPSP